MVEVLLGVGKNACALLPQNVQWKEETGMACYTCTIMACLQRKGMPGAMKVPARAALSMAGLSGLFQLLSGDCGLLPKCTIWGSKLGCDA